VPSPEYAALTTVPRGEARAAAGEHDRIRQHGPRGAFRDVQPVVARVTGIVLVHALTPNGFLPTVAYAANGDATAARITNNAVTAAIHPAG